MTSAPQNVMAVFEAAYPELYYHLAKGKICAGEPLYGAIITTMGATEIGHGESNVSADDALRIAIEDAGLSLPAILTDREARSVIPAGYKLVPVEPTWAMTEAGEDASIYHADDFIRNNADNVYRAMLSASPYPSRGETETRDPSALLLEAEKALEFYANPKNYIDTPSWDGDPSCITERAIPVRNEDGATVCDCGDRARSTLSKIRGGE